MPDERCDVAHAGSPWAERMDVNAGMVPEARRSGNVPGRRRDVRGRPRRGSRAECSSYAARPSSAEDAADGASARRTGSGAMAAGVSYPSRACERDTSRIFMSPG